MRNLLLKIGNFWPFALVAGILVFLFGRRQSPPDDDEVMLHGKVQDLSRRLATEGREHEIDDIQRDVADERDDIRDGGGDGFMDRAAEYDGANDDG